MIIGLDVGGTHTDAVLLNESGVVRETKVPTTADDLIQPVLTALRSVTRDIVPREIQRMVLSTTLTTNAVVEGKLGPVGMIVTAGPGIDPAYFKTNAHYYTTAGSIDHRGREVTPIDNRHLGEIAARLQAEGIRHVGVVGKFSVRNPLHENQIGELLKPDFEKIFLGHQISGSLNFGRRIATTYLNAAVYPIHQKFYAAVESSLNTRGLQIPIRLLKADGGNMRFDASMDHPIQTILSGPAASVMGAVAFGARKADTLVMDIGGTTTDMAVLIDRVPVLNPVGIELGDYKTLIRSLETYSIGIGGDSAVRIVDGLLTIGPERHGPAMAYGGPTPTPTDALAVLGDIENLNPERSQAGLRPLADELGLGVGELAADIVRQACMQILTAADRLLKRINSKPVYTVHELQEGYVVKPQHILVLGGPAPYFARHLERHSTYRASPIPHWHVANAIGAALARTTCEVTLLADSERGLVSAHEEGFSAKIDRSYDLKAAREQAYALLREKALQRGANPDFLEMETVESLAFNMVRGFSTTGRNIRVKVQVKPGLIHGYEEMIAALASG